MDSKIYGKSSKNESGDDIEEVPNGSLARAFAGLLITPLVDLGYCFLKFASAAVRIRLLGIDRIKTPKHLSERKHNLTMFGGRRSWLGWKFYFFFHGYANSVFGPT